MFLRDRAQNAFDMGCRNQDQRRLAKQRKLINNRRRRTWIQLRAVHAIFQLVNRRADQITAYVPHTAQQTVNKHSNSWLCRRADTIYGS